MDLSKSIVDGIGSYVQNWLQEHWLIWWLLTNPVWTLVILLVLIGFFVGLLGAIGRSIEHFWVWLLQKPWQVLVWLGQKVPQRQPANAQGARAQRIDYLMRRIAQIQQEQDKLLRELTQMVKVERQK